MIIHEPDPPMNATASSAASGGAASASSAAPDASALAEKAIAALLADLAAEDIDPKRKARSQDPGWKYGWWPDPMKKDFVRCIFCKKVIPSRIKRFKQHVAGGFGDTVKCAKVPEIVSKEMYAYLRKNSKTVLVDMSEEEANEDTEPQPVPSSGTKIKQANRRIAQAAITSFVVQAPPKPATAATTTTTKPLVPSKLG